VEASSFFGTDYGDAGVQAQSSKFKAQEKFQKQNQLATLT